MAHELTDISDIAALAETLRRTANMAQHFAQLCEQKDSAIAERDTTIIALKQELEQCSSNKKEGKK